MDSKTKIFVDGNCVVCDFEISHYKRLAPHLFDIVDISDPDFKAENYKLSAAAVNKHLHVLTPQDKILVGVDAFAHIWSRLPIYKIASRAVRLPVVKQVSDVGYAIFAEIRPFLPKKAADR